MPNIEIHGMPESEARLTVRRIAALLRNSSFVKEVVISLCNDIVLDLEGNDQPYLRVFCNDGSKAKEVVLTLDPLKIDIELIQIWDFIPKK